MNTKISSILFSALIIASPCFPENLSAAESEDAADRSRSPRSVHAETGASSSPYLDQLEFRSLANLPGGMIFSLRDPLNGQTFWIELGQTRNEVEAISFNPDRNFLTVRSGDAVRTIPLNASRILAMDDQPAVSAASTDARDEWRDRREQWAAFMERWQGAVSESAELREIETNLRELTRDLRQVTSSLNAAEEGSEAHRRLTEQRGELARDFRVLHRHTTETLNEHPDFEADDVQMVHQMFRMTWNQPARN